MTCERCGSRCAAEDSLTSVRMNGSTRQWTAAVLYYAVFSAAGPRGAAFSAGPGALVWAPVRADCAWSATGSPPCLAARRARRLPRGGLCGLRGRAGSAETGAADAGGFPALAAWLCECGGFVHDALAVTEDDGGAGRGLVASRAVRQGEQLLVVPRAAQLREPRAEEDPQLLALIDAVKLAPGLHMNTPLALRLLQEKCRPVSSFGPYLRMLPASYDAMPDCYAEHIPEIQFANVEQRAVARINELVRLTEALDDVRTGGVSDALSGASVDIGAVMWACATASSRGFELPWRPDDDHGALAGALCPAPRDMHAGRLSMIARSRLHRHTPAASSRGTPLGACSGGTRPWCLCRIRSRCSVSRPPLGGGGEGG